MGVPTSPAAGRGVRQGADKQTAFWSARSSTVGEVPPLRMRIGVARWGLQPADGMIQSGGSRDAGSAMWWMWEVRGRRVARSLRQVIIGALATLAAYLWVSACAPL